MARQDAFVLDDKGRALLGKLRKGADASLSLPQLFKVLRFLGGWTVEDVVSFIPLHYEKGDAGSDHGMKYALWTEDEGKARQLYDVLRSLQVRNVPAHPKLGDLAVMDLEPFQSYPHAHRKAWGAPYRVWAAVPGYRITDPNGQVFEVLPNRIDLSSGMSVHQQDAGLPKVDAKVLLKRLRVWDAMRWLKERTPYLDQINAVLGTEHHRPGAARTRENTGTCGACFRNIKLEHPGGGKLPVTALHGYKRPGTGSIEGRCTGENMPPYELSAEATKLERSYYISRHADVVRYIARLKAGEVTEFSAYFGAPVVRQSGLPSYAWETELRNQIKRTERERDGLEIQLRIYGWLVDHWQKRDLPKPNEIEVDYMGIAARKLRASEWAARAG